MCRDRLKKNYETVRDRIAAACEKSGRNPDDVSLICVSKTVDSDWIRWVHAAGATVFGENYAQELKDKKELLRDLNNVRWHFIGALQRNKVKYVVGDVDLIHSVDHLSLLNEIEQRAQKRGCVQQVLVQLNLAHEETKSGIDASELETFLRSFKDRPHCRCVGLMTMPPFHFTDPQLRAIFARLRVLRDTHARETYPGVELHHLSMGMTSDFEIAIEEGATLVRIGTAIFGARGT